MSTAVLERPAVDEQAYVMPEVVLGQHVLVYPGGDVNPRNEVPAIVIRQYRRSITANCFSHGDMAMHSMVPKEQLRHVSDPSLKNPNIAAEGGAWDYTPWEKALRARIADLETKVEKLVNDLGGPSTKGKKAD